MTESRLPVVRMHPYRWGDPDRAVGLPEAATAALAALGVQPPPRPAVPPAQARLPEPDLPERVRAALERLLGPAAVRSDAAARVRHTRGRSTADLLRLRSGDAADAPDAVVLPADAGEVLAVLRLCTEERVAVVPYAGGTSVVGGLVAARAGLAGLIALDVARLDGLTDLDTESRTVRLGAGLRGPAAETALNDRGWTLGHFPQSYEGAAIGGYAATRSAGQSSAGYGRFDEMVVGLGVATPSGPLRLGTAPRSAAGPDLRQLVLGSEGTLGVITDVTVRVRPVPEQRVFEGWRFDTFARGVAAVRALAQDGPLPTVLRLSDEAETAINLADPRVLGTGPAGCLAVVGWEGAASELARERPAAAGVLAAAGGEPLGPGAGEAWRAGRYLAPYLRDPLLDAGAFVETLETAAFWSALLPLRSGVTAAVTAALGGPVVVLCHVSHVYETGASLYFTVLCAQGEDPIARWRAAKDAAGTAIRAAGGTITHHHGVGTEHRAGYQEEIGPIGLALLRAAKAAVDPAGILNPGVLLG